MLLATDHNERTVFHVAAQGYNLHILQEIIEWAKVKLTTEEVNKLLATDDSGRTVIHFAALSDNLKILEKLRH